MNEASCSFSITEFLVYCAAATLLIIFLFEFMVKLTQEHKQLTMIDRTLINSCLGLDLMRREISQAPSAKNLWFKMMADSIVWCVADKQCCGYSIDKTVIRRIEGLYDIRYGRWRDKSSSLVITPITRGSFHFMMRDDLVIAVELAISLAVGPQEKKINELIALRNRRLG